MVPAASLRQQSAVVQSLHHKTETFYYNAVIYFGHYLSSQSKEVTSHYVFFSSAESAV